MATLGRLFLRDCAGLILLCNQFLFVSLSIIKKTDWTENSREKRRLTKKGFGVCVCVCVLSHVCASVCASSYFLQQ